jgi:hypothetical protein
MSLLALSGTNSVSGGYEIDNSLKFERANSEQIYTSNAASGNRKTWTFSAWIKRTQLSQDYSTVFSCGYSNIQFMSNDRPRLILYNGSSEVYADPEMLMRDTSAWYHIVVQVDSTQSTAADRVKWWINGDRITDFNNSTYTNMSQNEDFDFGQAGSGSDNYLRLGEFFGGSEGFSGYMSDVYYLNGTAAQASDFGEYDDDSGIWIPKKYTGSGYGTQGFKYEFKDSSALGTDTSGEGHNANNLSNITSADQAVDTPTNNFAIISNAMRDSNELSYSTVSDGGSLFRVTTASRWVVANSSIGVTKGKWYAEFNVIGSRPNNMWGIASMEQLNNNSGYSSAGSHLGESGKNWGIGYYQANGGLFEQQNSGYTVTTSWGSVVSQNQIVGVALDMDNHKLYMAVNNTYQNSGDPTSGATGTGAISFDATETVAIATTGYSLGSGNDTITGVNFGGYKTGGMPSQATDENGYGAFRYAPPSGYYALCSRNLSELG